MTRFEVWAPKAERADVVVDDKRLALNPGPRDGWWSLDVPTAGDGTKYAFSLDGGPSRPDPRSRFQPHGVHGPSQVVAPRAADAADAATPAQWSGRSLTGAVVYELHIGTFTPAGTFDSAIERLDHLSELGVGFVEVMPVNAYSGGHGWGYDGVGLWAVHEPYGGPAGFHRFIDACHERGLGVLLDVVYNHLGPSGNYLAEFGPYFTDRHHTPWGPAVNLDDAGSDEVRAFIVENALYWLEEFGLDGLRLDAVHSLADTRAVHILEELSTAVDQLAERCARPLTLIAESDLNDPRMVTPRAQGGLGMHAQWNDDFHHALHSLATGERQGYYSDFGSVEALAKTMTHGYFHDGTWSSFRGRSHGRPVDVELIPGDRFVGFLQDHDQIGNRAQGDRISATVSPGLLRVGAALLLTAPCTPMLFMGEEWAAATPWQFFTDHPEPELGRAVSEGRRREFASHGWTAEDVPDPQDLATFERSKLDWAEVGVEPHRSVLEWYRALIALRGQWVELADPHLTQVVTEFDEKDRWLVIHRGRLRVVANLAADPRVVPLDVAATGILLASDEGVGLAGPGSVSLVGESVVVVDTGVEG
ncbi:MAG TPA: malto-oligosyltrehalose trehalohydrolase [Actinocrinis sp.]|nr:malto-oligosyltrehalose trehalohydrolase [Actinocrinis sp.]